MTVAFDTLKLARRLEAAGFPTKQAQDTAEALGDALTSNIATQADIQALRADLRAEIATLRVEMIKWVVGVGVAGVLAIGGMLLALMRMLPHL